MKNITHIFLITISLLVVTSCDEFLDRAPLSDMSPATYFANKGDMKAWTAGIYDSFQSTLSLGHLEWGDIRSDNYHTTSYDDGKAYMNAIESTQNQYSWENIYKTIDRCNVAIERFPNIPGTVEGDWSDYVGQAYGMRAYMYFYAIRVWGDVPLITVPWDGDVESSYVPRSPVADIKAQILSDLEQATRLLSTGVTADRKFYFNLAAAWALKIDLDMWFNEYQQVVDDFDSYFKGSSNFELVANDVEWKNIFLSPADSKETIFNMSWNYEADGANPWAQRVGASNTNNPYKVSQGIFDEFVTRLRSGEGADGRFWNVLDTVKMFYGGNQLPISTSHWLINANAGVEKCTKYSPEDLTSSTNKWLVLSSSNCDIQPSLYRYADMLLLKAEALNQLGKAEEALQIVNQIRQRVGYMADASAEVDLSDKKAVENIILLERQLEFMAEGKRWFDLVRTGNVVEVMDPILRARQEDAGVEPSGFGDEGRILFPIYYREFESNRALRGHQNPPYTEG
jgi:tetratricopeptide (TPR) repeat protein